MVILAVVGGLSGYGGLGLVWVSEEEDCIRDGANDDEWDSFNWNEMMMMRCVINNKKDSLHRTNGMPTDLHSSTSGLGHACIATTHLPRGALAHAQAAPIRLVFPTTITPATTPDVMYYVTANGVGSEFVRIHKPIQEQSRFLSLRTSKKTQREFFSVLWWGFF